MWTTCCFSGAVSGAVHGDVENAVLVLCATFVEEKLLGGAVQGGVARAVVVLGPSPSRRYNEPIA